MDPNRAEASAKQANAAEGTAATRTEKRTKLRQTRWAPTVSRGTSCKLDSNPDVVSSSDVVLLAVVLEESVSVVVYSSKDERAGRLVISKAANSPSFVRSSALALASSGIIFIPVPDILFVYVPSHHATLRFLWSRHCGSFYLLEDTYLFHGQSHELCFLG